MAIDSDVVNPDSRLHVTFYKRAIEIKDESAAQGRPIFREYDFVKILVPGDALNEIDTIARDGHKERFPRQWAAYMNKVGNEGGFEGTPLSQWPQVSISQAEELKGLKFHTVESIAHASDQQLQKIGMIAGMSPYQFRDKAKSFLNLATESAEASKKDAELESLRQENAKIKAETDAKLTQMEERMTALLAAVGEKKPKTRKPKVVEA